MLKKVREMGDIESLKNILAFNRAQPTVEEEALENNECPHDGFALKTNSKGERACEFCGRIYR